MGRNPKFEDKHFISAAQDVIATDGLEGLNVHKIARQAGATTGSLYHRFSSVDELAAMAWMEAAESFQSQFAVALSGSSLEQSVLAGALVTPEWSRKNLTAARVLLRTSAATLKQQELPPALHRRLGRLQSNLRRTILGFASRFESKAGIERIELFQFLLADMPLAAVTPYLKRGESPPDRVNKVIRTAISGFYKQLKK
ncbi:MAG: TetR/AcrR family transcriptional regulator [Leptospiraceae bacterium]|nr:TetR/AcrR family transcriptional regulator [Leptospiraceae bacterium]MCB1305332.1 TetR/AcrR family transcriptional regulator [Leptospiraceae bacterium]